MEWICLRVKIIYDNGDDTWLVYSNVEGDWYIAYHGGIDIPKKMLENGFQTRSSRQIYKYKDNMNPLTNEKISKCNEGFYLTPSIEEAER